MDLKGLNKNEEKLNEVLLKGQEFKDEKKELNAGPKLNGEINKDKHEIIQDQKEVPFEQLKVTTLNKDELEFVQGKDKLDITKMGQGMSLTMLDHDYSEAAMRANVKDILRQYLDIRKKVLDGKGENDLSEDERLELGTAYERLESSVNAYVATHGEQATHGKATKNLKRMARIKELIHMDNRYFMLSEGRRKMMKSLDASNEGDTAFPTFLKARHAADSISIRNQIYKDNLKKQAEKGKNVSTSGQGWWKTAMLNNVDRLKVVYNGVGGVIDRTIGIGVMIASNTLILGGKIVKLPLKLLSMAFNKISKKCKSKKRWTVDYSITKGWAGLSESRQIFRDCAKGLVALPVGVYDSIVHGFPYLFRKMTGSIKKTDKVYRTSGKLFKGIGERIFGIMRGLGFTKQYPDLSEIDEASLLDKTVMDAAEELDETLHKEDKEKEKEGKENSKAKKIRENQQELEGLFDELDEKEENKEKEENEKKEDEKKEDEKKEDEKKENEKKEDEKKEDEKKEDEKKEDEKKEDEKKEDEKKEDEKKEDDKKDENEKKEDEEKHDEKNEEKDKEQEKNEEKEKEENKEKEEKKEEHYSSPEERLEKMEINPDTIREFKAVYNAEAKAYHEQELKKFKKKIPKDKGSAEKLINTHKGWVKDSKGLEKHDWLPEISEELKKHLNWLFKYYTVNDPTLDTNRKGVLKRLEMGNYNVSMEEPGMDEAYENQGTNNCYACSATAMLNQYIAHHKNKNKNEKEKVEHLYNQYNFREYKPNVRLYDPKFNGIMDKLGYDRNVKHIGQYAGKGKRDVGSVFVLGDFILDKLEKNGIKDAMLNRMVFTLPEENSKDTKETKERNETKINNMRAVFAEKIAGIVGSGGVASVLVDHGHYAHYITITGINGNDVEVYDSYGYKGNKETRSISDILKAGWYVELNWISEKKKPEELTKEFKRLKYDEKDGYSVDYTSHNQVAESITHTKGVTVVKDDVEMGEEYEDIAHMAYIPDEKKIESLPFDNYIKAISKKGKKNGIDETMFRDKGWVVYDDAENSQDYTEEEFKEKLEEKKGESEKNKEKEKEKEKEKDKEKDKEDDKEKNKEKKNTDEEKKEEIIDEEKIDEEYDDILNKFDIDAGEEEKNGEELDKIITEFKEEEEEAENKGHKDMVLCQDLVQNKMRSSTG